MAQHKVRAASTSSEPFQKFPVLSGTPYVSTAFTGPQSEDGLCQRTWRSNSNAKLVLWDVTATSIGQYLRNHVVSQTECTIKKGTRNSELVLTITQALAVQVSVSYLSKLRQFFISGLQDNPSMLLQTAFFQQDCAVPHFARSVKLFMNGACPDRWIGRGGQKNWPACSPDLTHMGCSDSTARGKDGRHVELCYLHYLINITVNQRSMISVSLSPR